MVDIIHPILPRFKKNDWMILSILFFLDLRRMIGWHYPSYSSHNWEEWFVDIIHPIIPRFEKNDWLILSILSFLHIFIPFILFLIFDYLMANQFENIPIKSRKSIKVLGNFLIIMITIIIIKVLKICITRIIKISLNQ